MNQVGQNACNIEDVTIECGAVESRRKRDTGALAELKIKFKVKMEPVSKLATDCKTKCESTSRLFLFDDCFSACETDVERGRRDILENISTDIKIILNSGETTERSTERPLEGISKYSRVNAHAAKQVCI